jgi:malate dehydrogenase (oxaloacetate-decarboxylating)(NADP+)
MQERNHPVGMELLTNPALNKSTAFTDEERERYGLRGLLPTSVSTQELQQQRVMENLRRKAYDIERYIFLLALMARNERLFYRTAMDHIEEILPLIYTPTVGQACKEYAHIYRQPRGLFLTLQDRGHVQRTLANWPSKDVRVIVVTDGERILGLGDLGANGMGIPVGKLALYTTCAGIHPAQCLPVTLDVGTNNEELLGDPLYIGVRSKRVGGEPYFELVEEFVEAVQQEYPDALIQFEDFLTPNAHGLLNKYRDRVLCFNDDIQGTAAVALAGMYASTRISGLEFKDLRVLFLGAGSAATGIGELLVDALVAEGVDEQEARGRVWFVDSGGLVVRSREHLAEHKLPFAHDHATADFLEALRSIRPHVLIGATGQPGTFNREAIELMSEINPRPTIFALSNPTSRAECTAEQAYRWSNGRAIFASGSPSPEVEIDGRKFRPGQGNNVYIFPGVGLAAVACKARRITDEMFLTAARVLADQVSEEDLAAGSIYPSLTLIREVSLYIAEAVVRKMQALDLALEPIETNIRKTIAQLMYDPTY